MIVHAVREPPGPELARALAAFETQFTYPLGPGRWFRIEHGKDYARFFRAIGEATCFVAERDGEVIGTLGVAIRRLLLPDGREQSVAYFGDLKVAPAARNGHVLLRLSRAADDWARPQVAAAFAVVMAGTPVEPTIYTGRAGIESFQQIGEAILWRLVPPSQQTPIPADAFLSADKAGQLCFRELSRGRYAAPAGHAAERSLQTPCWLVHPDSTACGLLEDTRRAKRLFTDDDVELLSAHLSNFAFRTPEAGAAILRSALELTAKNNLPALFVAVAPAYVRDLQAALGVVAMTVAPALIFGAGLPAGGTWNINTSEI